VIWTAELDALSELAQEQATAKGDFPGPCPLCFSGSSDEVAKAVDSGASAVVLTSGDLGLAGSLDVEVIWQVGSVAEVEAIIEAGQAAAAFLVDSGPGCAAILAAIPSDSAAVACIDAMQEANAEIALGKQLKDEGCSAVLLRGACVGDEEDVPYVRFAVGGLTSKASAEYQITGLTGAANGHFGTGSFRKDKGAVEWARRAL